MGNGILICGLNGAGKSTLGRALAAALGYHMIDSEGLYFDRISDGYSAPRPRAEAVRLLLDEVQNHPNFILAAVKGDFCEEILPLYSLVILLDVPRNIRMQRLRCRAWQAFGERILPGGDLHEQEEAFFRFAEGRAEDTAERWVQTLHCPVLRLDGTRPIEDNLTFILSKKQNSNRVCLTP